MKVKTIKHAIRIGKEFGIGTLARIVIAKITKNEEMYIKTIEPELSKYISYGFHNDSEANNMEQVPIWIFWWQGYDNMPEICKVCFNSVKRNMPEDAKLVLITAENYEQYVDIPEAIIKKIEEGIYTITLFSDLLRNQLLYRYGGIWLDATLLCVKPIESQLLKSNSFWSVKLDENDYYPKSVGTAITKNLWAGFIQKAPIHSRLNGILYSSLLCYMNEHNVLLEYFIQNVMIRSLYENDQDIKNSIDGIESSNSNMYVLGNIMSETFDVEKWNDICKDTTFMKLSWKSNYRKEINNQQTFFGKICTEDFYSNIGC